MYQIGRYVVWQRRRQQHLPGDALGVVTDALERPDDLAGRIDETQGRGSGLVAEDELGAEPVHFRLVGVHVLVTQDDRVGHLAVGLQKGLERPVQGPLVQVCHFQQLLPDQVDVMLEERLQMRRGWCRHAQYPRQFSTSFEADNTSSIGRAPDAHYM